MRKFSFNLLALLAVTLGCVTLTSCGTSKKLVIPDFDSSPKTTVINTIPSGAKVFADGRLVCTTTPGEMSVPVLPSTSGLGLPDARFIYGLPLDKGTLRKLRKESTIKLQIVKDGYEVLKADVVPSFDEHNLLVWPENLLYELKERKDAYVKDPTIPAGAANERVTRDTSGNTAMERTIIRWYFDSAPHGANIFWRVISSVPSEVKNTNELWLGSTPFEETRAFNIQGLTYENSRDVQIEIKVKRRGYVDQNKRFNVRQALDQQEISSFFDLIEE